MGKRTKKVGISGKYGTRYGASLRKLVKKIETTQHAKVSARAPCCAADVLPRVPCLPRTQRRAGSGLGATVDRRGAGTHDGATCRASGCSTRWAPRAAAAPVAAPPRGRGGVAGLRCAASVWGVGPPQEGAAGDSCGASVRRTGHVAAPSTVALAAALVLPAAAST